MGKRIGLRDFSVRTTDRSHDDVCFVHSRLSVWLAWLKLLSGLGLLVIFVVPLVAQTNAVTPDVSNTLFEIPSRQYLFGDWGGKRSKLAEKGVTEVRSVPLCANGRRLHRRHSGLASLPAALGGNT